MGSGFERQDGEEKKAGVVVVVVVGRITRVGKDWVGRRERSNRVEEETIQHQSRSKTRRPIAFSTDCDQTRFHYGIPNRQNHQAIFPPSPREDRSKKYLQGMTSNGLPTTINPHR